MRLAACLLPRAMVPKFDNRRKRMSILLEDLEGPALRLEIQRRFFNPAYPPGRRASTQGYFTPFADPSGPRAVVDWLPSQPARSPAWLPANYPPKAAEYDLAGPYALAQYRPVSNVTDYSNAIAATFLVGNPRTPSKAHYGDREDCKNGCDQSLAWNNERCRTLRLPAARQRCWAVNMVKYAMCLAGCK